MTLLQADVHKMVRAKAIVFASQIINVMGGVVSLE